MHSSRLADENGAGRSDRVAARLQGILTRVRNTGFGANLFMQISDAADVDYIGQLRGYPDPRSATTDWAIHAKMTVTVDIAPRTVF
jgi:hypothetical protein